MNTNRVPDARIDEALRHAKSVASMIDGSYDMPIERVRNGMIQRRRRQSHEQSAYFDFLKGWDATLTHFGDPTSKELQDVQAMLMRVRMQLDLLGECDKCSGGITENLEPCDCVCGFVRLEI